MGIEGKCIEAIYNNLLLEKGGNFNQADARSRMLVEV